MTETYLHAETEEIVDAKNFSGLSLVAVILSLVGSFSVLYVHFLAIAIIAAIVGCVVLQIASKYQLSGFSKFLALLAIFISSTTGSWGVFRRSMETNQDVQQARVLAEKYLNYLSQNDLNKALLLQGVPADVVALPPTTLKEMQPSPADLAKQKIDTETAFREIRNRKSPAKWTYLGLNADFAMETSHLYKLLFRDDGQTNPPTYFVYVRKDCPKAGPAAAPYNKGKVLQPSDLVVHWYLDTIESALKLD
jgi:hypothetical protein